ERDELEFIYDAMGNRIAKIAKPFTSIADPLTWTTTHYVRDASGNVMATYQDINSIVLLQNHHLFGASRLGVEAASSVDLNTDADITQSDAGIKMFELSNHLGNVLAVVSDRKTGIDGEYIYDNTLVGTYQFNQSNGPEYAETSGAYKLTASSIDGTVNEYTADIVSMQDYYPFGMEQPDRTYKPYDYRYGFNGKEKDDELKNVSGSSYNFDARLYDPRLGRFLSVDKLTNLNPGWTPYRGFLNNPISVIDPDGNVERDAQTGRIIFVPLQKDNYEDVAGDGNHTNVAVKGDFGYITANDGKTQLPVMLVKTGKITSMIDGSVTWQQLEGGYMCAYGSNCYGSVLTNGNYLGIAGGAMVHEFLIADGYDMLKNQGEKSKINLELGDILFYSSSDHIIRVVDFNENGEAVFESRFGGDEDGALGTLDEINAYHDAREEGGGLTIDAAAVYRSMEGDVMVDPECGNRTMSNEKKIENVRGGKEPVW
ncbi:MAG: RHS repeat-associated core domain-containing protein, partial [Flavobacteriales bacterium]|nr:RHS repeat-associated core domain-containing protein [Flavobacteriales bacterium]